MEKRERDIFLERIVDLHHAGQPKQARAVLKALEATLPPNSRTEQMQIIYLLIERLEQGMGFWAKGSSEDRGKMRRMHSMREQRTERWEV